MCHVYAIRHWGRKEWQIRTKEGVFAANPPHHVSVSVGGCTYMGGQIWPAFYLKNGVGSGHFAVLSDILIISLLVGGLWWQQVGKYVEWWVLSHWHSLLEEWLEAIDGTTLEQLWALNRWSLVCDHQYLTEGQPDVISKTALGWFWTIRRQSAASGGACEGPTLFHWKDLIQERLGQLHADGLGQLEAIGSAELG